MIWDYVDEDGSTVEFTKDSSPVTGGLEIGTVVVTPGSSLVIRLNENNITAIYPGSTLAIVGSIPTGAANDIQASITWQEDL